MNTTMRLTFMALLVAIGTVGASFLWFPAGVAKAYPVQHAINVLSAVILGPSGAVAVAFAIGLIRNITGLGSVLAFPGGMIGALLAGYMYQKTKHVWGAAVGEVIGTGVIGALVSVPLAALVLGKNAGAFAFIPPFLVSTVSGTILALLLLPFLRKSPLGKYMK